MNPHDARQSGRSDFVALVDRLVADYAGLVPANSVISYAAGAREELLHAGVRAGLLDATESMTRRRLSQLIPAHV